MHAPECQPAVTFEAVPAQVGGLESFAGHGLHGIAEKRLDVADFREHLAVACTNSGDSPNFRTRNAGTRTNAQKAKAPSIARGFEILKRRPPNISHHKWVT